MKQKVKAEIAEVFESAPHGSMFLHLSNFRTLIFEVKLNHNYTHQTQVHVDKVGFARR